MKQVQIEYDIINSSGEWETVTAHEWTDEPSIYTAEIQQTHLVDIVETFKVEATDMEEAVRLAFIEAREREQINHTTYNLNSIALDK